MTTADLPRVPVPRLDDRLRTAYATAMHHTHRGGRVELHLGEAVTDHLKALCVKIDEAWTPPEGTVGRAWGFPIVPVENNPAHISVHVVTDIF